MHFYFFKSTNSKDKISGISVFSNSLLKATAIAHKIFTNNNCKGKPVLMSL